MLVLATPPGPYAGHEKPSGFALAGCQSANIPNTRYPMARSPIPRGSMFLDSLDIMVILIKICYRAHPSLQVAYRLGGCTSEGLGSWQYRSQHQSWAT